MGTYIARRLLLMIPTLVGITFLVFMLVALSPGGIGASLRVAGGQMEASKRAQQEAYLEDRYGLDDPPPVQYVRWLGRISPLKFGRREQTAPQGESIRPPKRLKPPLLWTWYADSLPPTTPATFEWPRDADDNQKSIIYRRAANEYAMARAEYVGRSAELQQAIATYARAVGRRDAVTSRGKVRAGALEAHTPERDRPEWQPIEELGKATVAAFAVAQDARERVAAVFAARPYPESGIGIIPGVVSLSMPDFGVSFSRGIPVVALIRDALPVTLLLNLLAFPIIYAVSIPTGIAAATRQGTWIDVGSGALFIALWSIPTVWAGTLAMGFLASNQYLGWFPATGLHDSASDTFRFLPTFGPGGFQRGYLFDTLWHIVLPVLCLVYTGFAVLSKQTRAAMLDNFNADYVRTAKAKGVSGRDIVFRHVFRNSLLPVITMFVTIFPATLAGSVVIEKIFSIPGMGSLILEAIYLRDRELILANTLMIAAVNLAALLVADILYAFADPRISYE